MASVSGNSRIRRSKCFVWILVPSIFAESFLFIQVRLVVLPNLELYLRLLNPELSPETQQNEMKRYEAWRVYGALQVCTPCSNLFLGSEMICMTDVLHLIADHRKLLVGIYRLRQERACMKN